MTAFRDGVTRLAERTEREIDALFARYERGQIDRGTFVAIAAQVIARARARGASLADLTLAAEAIRQVRDETGPIGIMQDDETERLQESVTTVLDERPEYVDDEKQLRESQRLRLGRLARDASVEAAVFGMARAMTERGVPGWTRETDIDPCPVCSRLADGIVRPPSVVMKRHVKCACVQRPAFT